MVHDHGKNNDEAVYFTLFSTIIETSNSSFSLWLEVSHQAHIHKEEFFEDGW
jgi:hypothetical protein